MGVPGVLVWGQDQGNHKTSPPPVPEHDNQTYQRHRSIAALTMENKKQLVFSLVLSDKTCKRKADVTNTARKQRKNVD